MSSVGAAAGGGSEVEELALSKLSRVLGAANGRRIFDEVLRQMGVKRLVTPDDLYAFADALTRQGGFEGAVGGLLGVTAVMRGASGPR